MGIENLADFIMMGNGAPGARRQIGGYHTVTRQNQGTAARLHHQQVLRGDIERGRRHLIRLRVGLGAGDIIMGNHHIKTGEQLRAGAAGKILLDIAAKITSHQRQRHARRVQIFNEAVGAGHERRAFLRKNGVAQREPVRDEVIQRHFLPQRLAEHLEINLRRFADQRLKQCRFERQFLAHNQLAKRAVNQTLRIKRHAVLVERDRPNLRLHNSTSRTAS